MRVIVLKARDLVKADITLLGKGKSDPFVRVKGKDIVMDSFHRLRVSRLAQGNNEFKTKTVNNTTEPEWNEVCVCISVESLSRFVFRSSNSPWNNVRAIVSNSRSLMKIQAKMISLEG